MNGKDYLCWLMNQAQIVAEGPEGYLKLCEVLHSVYFVSLVRMDENRGCEGKALREEWADAYGGDIQDLERELLPYTCTMMELIAVLARRMEYEMMDSQFEAGIGKWTRELLENAGLAYFRNDIYDADPGYSEARIRRILSDIIYRRYGQDGLGGFFPMAGACEDQRSGELLTQMNDYLAENYDIC